MDTRLARRGRPPGHAPRVVLLWLAALFFPLNAFADTTATTPALPKAAPGQTVTVTVKIPTTDGPAGTPRFTVEPAADVSLQGPATGALTWNPSQGRPLVLVLQLQIPKKQPVGPFVAARVTVQWPDGHHQTLDARVDVAALPPGSSSKDMEVEVIPAPRAAGPGGVIKLMYAIFSYEDTDERVRLRVEVEPGWRLLDPEAAGREILVEAWEVVEGELYLVVPEDARIGSRHVVRLLAEVVGEAGELEGRNHVSVARRGGARPGTPTLTGSSTIGLSQLGAAAAGGPRRAGAFELSSKFNKTSTFSFSFDQGLRNTLSNFRYEEERTRITGSLRHAGWDLSFGNLVSAQGNALTGPYVRGRGVSVRRPSGLLVSEVTVAEPSTFGGSAAGHVVRGRAGVRTPRATLALSASDFGRPGGYTTLSTIQTTVLDAETQEQIEFERRLTTSQASNRVTGVGLESEYQPSKAHRLSVKAGHLALSNAAGLVAGGATGEASYALNTKPATFALRWRDTPAALAGVSIPGDELMADGALRLRGPVQLVARAHHNATETVGAALSSRGEGTSVGVRLTKGTRRVEVRGNYRESQYSTANIRRTISLSGSTPVGPLSFSGNADVGEQETGLRRDRLVYYRSDLRWSRETGSAWLGVSHSESMGIARQRVDVVASSRLREIELAGGAWATRGYTVGGRPGLWASVGLPVGFDSIAAFAVDYAPPTWTAAPALRGTISIRKRFVLPLPFLGSDGTSVPAPGAPPPVAR